MSVYGPWGSGKTWLLNKIEKRLIESGTIAIYKFSPWQFESNEQIATEFFASVLETLESQGSVNQTDGNSYQRALLWKSLGQIVTIGQLGFHAASSILGGESGIPIALGSLRKLLAVGEEQANQLSETPSASEIRVELKKLFTSPGAPSILVTIDDLDRLEDEQIRMILRLIKTTANFPNLNYLILGERKQMANALDPISGNAGDRYLEKLVQIPLTLPQTPESQIRGRLWDGLELIARDCNYDLDSQIERFESFWRQFLRSRLKHHRSVHRLLTITSFHSRSLTDNGELEVDLLDLIGIDFIRLFSPQLYSRIASDPPDEAWIISNREFSSSNSERNDSTVARELIEIGELDPKSSFHALAHLFPQFYSLLPQTAMERRFFSNDHRQHKLSAAEHPIWHDQFLPLYLQLSPQADHFPTSKYKEFLAAADSLHMVRLFEEWASKGWRIQLLQRLNDDLHFNESRSDPREFLLALSSISDDLDTSGSILERELDVARRVWLKRFAVLAEEEKLPFIERVFRESRGVSLSLLLLEYLRDRNSVTFSKGASADASIPQIT